MNFHPPEEDDPRDDDQRMQDAELTAPQGVASDDARFEAWAASKNWDVRKYDNAASGQYVASYTRDGLEAWRAALAQAGQAAPHPAWCSGGCCSTEAAPAGEVANAQELIRIANKLDRATSQGSFTDVCLYAAMASQALLALATPATEPAAPGYVSVTAALEALDSVVEPAWYGYECSNTWQDGKSDCIEALRALAAASTVQGKEKP